LSFLVEVLLVMSESALLRVSPVLVESLLGVLIESLSPNGGECTETTRSIDVTNNTNNCDGWAFNDSDSFDNFFLVVSGTRSLDISENVCHASLETCKSSQMGLLGRVILRE